MGGFDHASTSASANLIACLHRISLDAIADVQACLTTYFDARDEDDGGVLVLGGRSRVESMDEKDRYVAVLESMIRAATWTQLDRHLRHTPSHLEFAVATRHVNFFDFEHIPLSAPILAQIIDNALENRRSYHFNGVTCDVKGGLVHDFRHTSLIGLFIADYAANCARRRMGRKVSTSLAELSDRLMQDVGIALQFDFESPYAAVPAGWGQAVARHAFHTPSSPLHPHNSFLWAREAREQWSERFQRPMWKEVFK